MELIAFEVFVNVELQVSWASLFQISFTFNDCGTKIVDCLGKVLSLLCDYCCTWTFTLPVFICTTVNTQVCFLLLFVLFSPLCISATQVSLIIQLYTSCYFIPFRGNKFRYCFSLSASILIFESFVFPLLEEIRANLMTNMEKISKASFAQVVALWDSKPCGSMSYIINIDAFE